MEPGFGESHWSGCGFLSFGGIRVITIRKGEKPSEEHRTVSIPVFEDQTLFWFQQAFVVFSNLFLNKSLLNLLFFGTLETQHGGTGPKGSRF